MTHVEAVRRALLRNDRLTSAEDLGASLELLDGSNAPLATPPTFGDPSRTRARKPEDHLGRRVAHAVRPELVAQSQDIGKSLLDVIKAQNWELEALSERRCKRRFPGPGAHDVAIMGSITETPDCPGDQPCIYGLDVLELPQAPEGSWRLAKPRPDCGCTSLGSFVEGGAVTLDVSG